jgi:hypothetical protein
MERVTYSTKDLNSILKVWQLLCLVLYFNIIAQVEKTSEDNDSSGRSRGESHVYDEEGTKWRTSGYLSQDRNAITRRLKESRALCEPIGKSGLISHERQA